MMSLPHSFNAQIDRRQQIQAEERVLPRLFNNAQTKRKSIWAEVILTIHSCMSLNEQYFHNMI